MTSSSDRWRRFAITAIVVAGLFALRGVPLPGVDPEVLAEMNDAAPEGMGLAFSVALLGWMPWLTAMITVELGALLRRRWRVRRVGSPQDRAQLWNVTRWIWLAVCTIQALTVATSLEAVVVGQAPLVVAPGPGFRLLTILTLTAGSAFFALGARAIDRWGFGRGFAVLASLQMIETLATELTGIASDDDTDQLGLLPASVSLLAAWWLLPVRRPPGIPLLSAGACPSVVARSALALAAAAGLVSEYDLPGRIGFSVAVTVVTTIVLSTLLHLPQATASVFGCTEGEARRALRSTWPGAALAGTLLTLAELAPWSYGEVWSSVFSIMLFGYLWDLADEWRARASITDPVVVWEFQRVFEVGPALDALASEGLTASVRGLHIREVAHIFAPHVPIEVLVPRESAADAARLLQRRLVERLSGSEGPA